MNEHIKIIEEDFPKISEAVYEKGKTTILIMPEDWTVSNPVYARTTESMLKLFRQADAAVALANDHASLDLRDNRSADWIAPTLFVSQLLLSENPAAISIALNIISAYVVDFFKGEKMDPSVRLNIFVETDESRTIKKIEYSGPASTIVELKDVLSQFVKKL